MISVIVPCYNAAQFLRKTVRSVQAQTFPNWELLLVDDGSKDDTRAVAEALAHEDSRVSVFTQENSGVSAARNHGLDKANPSFPYALCLDSDDLLLPDALQLLLTLLELNPDAPAACGFLQDIDAEGRLTSGFDRLESLTGRRGVNGFLLVRRRPKAPLVFGDLCFHNHIISSGQVLLRKSALAVHGAFDVSLSYIADYDLWWRLAMQAGPIAVTAVPVLLYRHHPSSMSGNSSPRRRDAAVFRWRLLTHPAMSAQQKRIARLGYFYHCLVGLEFGLHYVRKGEIKHGLKHAALGVRDLLLFVRDMARA